MINKNRNIVVILILAFLIQIIFLGLVWADDWTQTSQSDFDVGIKTNVDTFSDPGNVTLSQVWIKNPTNPVLDLGSPSSWDDDLVWAPRVLYDGATYHMWYSGDDGVTGRIGYANSSNGITWTKYLGNPILGPGPGAWEAQSVYVPTVLYDGVTYHMWYTGYDFSNIYRIGYANSSDGITWTKYSGNPVLDLGPPGAWDDYRVHANSVLYIGTTYHMWYSASDGSTQRIGYATSPDGITWTRHPANPVLSPGAAGSWDDVHAYYPTVHYDDTKKIFHMWYIGYDGTDLKIGYAISLDGIIWNKSATNPVLDTGPPGSWDDNYLYIPVVLYDGIKLNMWYTGEDGSNFRIGYATSCYQSSGNLISSVFDSNSKGTTWNFISWTEYLPFGTDITMATRSGDTSIPDASWSPWSSEMWDELGSAITSPRSRYIQYRATLSTIDQYITPILCEVNINYTLNTAQPPTLLLPPNDIFTKNNTPTFEWNFNDAEGDSQTGYTIQIDDDPSFLSVDYSSGDIDSGNSWWTPSVPISDGIWYWRVRTNDSYGLWSDYSNYWIIKIDTTPPIITDVIEDPDPQEVYGFVNITANITDNFKVYKVWINISGEGNFSMQYDPVNERYYLNRSYDVLSLYAFTIWANDTNDNWASVSSSFLIHDITPPIIIDVTHLPDPQEVFGNVNISANITDNYKVFGGWVEIFDPDGSLVGNFSLLYDSIDNRYYWNQSYDIVGTYIFTIWANDTSDNWASYPDTFIIHDTIPPTIIDVTVIPDPQEVFYDVNISAYITDNYQLSEVWMEIFNPDGFFVGNFSMLYDSIDNRYYWNQSYDIIGTYMFTIWANDTSNNFASYSDTFVIQDTTPPIIMDVTVILDPQEVFYDVNVSADINDNYHLFGGRVEIFDPEGVFVGNFSMLYDSINNRYYWNQSYDIIGTYMFTIWANDTSNNWASYLDTFVIQDTTPPMIIDVTVIPDPQEVFYDVNISADITDNYQLFRGWVEIFDPNGILVGNFSLLYDSIDNNYYWNQSYGIIGTYMFTIWANDTSNNWASYLHTFVVQDTTPPIIMDVIVIPDSQEVFNDVNISADITDNYQLFGVWVEIYYPNGSFVGNFSMLYDSIDNRNYWNQSYDIIGTYMFTIWANDTSNNWASYSDTFVIQDINPPIITDITAIPDPQEVFKTVNISAYITDDYKLYGGWIEVYDPNGNPIGNFSMLYDPITCKHYFNQTYNIIGIYNFTIWANDSSNNWASSSGSFVVEPQPEPRKYNWKPIIALIFTIILLIVGVLISYNRPIKFTGVLEKDRWYTFLLGVLPYVIAEVITGIISLFTGLLKVPPILGVGMIVDLIILIVGLISSLMIYEKDKYTTKIKKEAQPIPPTQSKENFPSPSEKQEDELPPPPPPSY